MTAEQLQEQLRLEVVEIARAQGADVVTAYVHDRETGRFHLPVAHGLLDKRTFFDPRLRLRSGRVAGIIARERQEIVATPVQGYAPMDGPFARREDIQSAAGFPLLHHKNTVGVLFVCYRRECTFDDEQRQSIRQQAQRLTDLIVAAKPWDNLRRSPEPLFGNPTLRAILELPSNSLNLAVAIWELQPGGKRLTLAAGAGLTSQYLDDTQSGVNIGDGSWLSKIMKGDRDRPVVVNNLLVDRRFPFKAAAEAARWKAALGFPLFSRGRVCGVIEGLSFDRTINPADEAVLRRMAGLAGVTIENTQRNLEADILREASTEIDRASTMLLDQDKVFEEIVDKVKQFASFDFAALQLIRVAEDVIETVHGVGRAANWAGKAKHFLETNPQLRDIDADIAKAKPPRVEIITGNDPRFDRWIFDTFHGDSLIRAFVPLVIFRDAKGRVLEGDDLDKSLEDWRQGKEDVGKRLDGNWQSLKLTLPKKSPERGDLSWQIIGTIEAGYDNSKEHTIELKQVFALAKVAARLAARVYRTSLNCVFQTVVDYAVKLVGAKYASLHFDRSVDAADPDDCRLSKPIPFAYEVFSGEVTKGFLNRRRPRTNGLGQEAITKGRASCIPDPFVKKQVRELKSFNKQAYDEGVRAMAAVPLLVELKQDGYAPPRGGKSDGSAQGVLYVGFGEEPGQEPDNAHRFTQEEIGWLEMFASSAANAIRHATAYTRMRDQTRLLENLHSVAESLVSDFEIPKRVRRAYGSTSPDDVAALTGGLLFHIAGSVLNILGADVVTIYEYLESEGVFLPDPDRAGRLNAEGKMGTEIGEQNAPTLIIDKCKKESRPAYYAPKSAGDPILDLPNRSRPGKSQSFVDREKIKSSAGILLVAGPSAGGEREVVGVMFINYRRPNRFPPAEKRLIETLASAAAVAIKNRRLLEEVIASRLLEEAVIATDRELLTAQASDEVITRNAQASDKVVARIDEVFLHIAERARVLTGAQVGEIFLIDPITRELRSKALSFPENGWDPKPPSDRLRWDFANRVKEEGVTLVPDRSRDGTGGSAFGVPLRDATAVLGVLAVFDSRPDAFHPRNRTLLEALAYPAVLAHHNDESRKQLRAAGNAATLGWLSTLLVHNLGGFGGDIGSIRYNAYELSQRSNNRRVKTILDLADKIIERITVVQTWAKTADRRDRAPVDLRKLIQKVMDAKGWQRDRYQGEEELPHVRGHEHVFSRIFETLFKNAEQAVGPGGVTVCGQKRGDSERLDSERLEVVIKVHNGGPAIPEAILEVLGKQPVPSETGWGWGLYLSCTYVEHLGGHWDIRSAEGEGTDVVVVLPACIQEV